LRNFNKQHLILTKFYFSNVPFICDQTAQFQLNLPMQTIVTAAFVRSSQSKMSSIKQSGQCPVHGLLENSARNVLAPYPFSCLNSLIKTQLFAENIILLMFSLFWLRQQISLLIERLH